MLQVVLNPTVDGLVSRRGVSEVWATIRGGNGNEVFPTTATGHQAIVSASGSSNQWESVQRGIFIFDLSQIKVGSIIEDGATFETYVTLLQDELGGGGAVSLCDGVTASDVALAISDYQLQGGTKQAPTRTLASMSTGQYEPFVLNAAGKALIEAAVAGDGILKLCTRMETDRSNTPPSSWSNFGLSRMIANFIENGSNIPKITINFTPPTRGAPFFFD